MTEQQARRRAVSLDVAIGILFTVVIVVWFVRGGEKFLREGLGFTPDVLTVPWAWVLAAVIAVGYSAYTASGLPLVREMMVERSALKLVSIWTAFGSGIVEEIVFRQLLMDWLADTGFTAVWQVIGSAVVFGLGHAVWGMLGGGSRVGVGALLATTVLGAGLAVVYLVAGRNVLPAIAAHVAINLVIEPGLLVSAIMGHPDDREATSSTTRSSDA